jgi:muramidase (phage lysozyme)
MADLSPVARALLETIAGPESKGDYNVIYGGSQFDDYSDHPRQPVMITSGPNKGKYSTAAGKYQFLGSTWDDIAERYDIPDFSPASQDQAAWALATEEYRRDTGRDLEADLASGDLSRVAPSLRNQWTSLPGGIEQGIGGTAFANAYASNLGKAPTPAMRAIDQALLPNIGVGTMPKFSDLQGVMRPAQPKRGGILTAALDGIGNIANYAGQQAAPIMRSVQSAGQSAAPSIMKAALGSVAGRTAVIDPMIQRVFSSGAPLPPNLMVNAQRAVSQSGDTSVGNQAEAAAVRASAESYRNNRR